MEEMCGCGFVAPPPVLQEGPWGPLLLTTQALLCGGGGRSPGKKGNQTKKQNNKSGMGDCNSGSKHPPAPWVAQKVSPAHPPIPDFQLPLSNISIAGQEAPKEKLGLSVCLTWFQGVSEKPGLRRLRE